MITTRLIDSKQPVLRHIGGTTLPSLWMPVISLAAIIVPIVAVSVIKLIQYEAENSRPGSIEYTGGPQQRRFGGARALYHEPDSIDHRCQDCCVCDCHNRWRVDDYVFEALTQFSQQLRHCLRRKQVRRTRRTPDLQVGSRDSVWDHHQG